MILLVQGIVKAKFETVDPDLFFFDSLPILGYHVFESFFFNKSLLNAAKEIILPFVILFLTLGTRRNASFDNWSQWLWEEFSLQNFKWALACVQGSPL